MTNKILILMDYTLILSENGDEINNYIQNMSYNH